MTEPITLARIAMACVMFGYGAGQVVQANYPKAVAVGLLGLLGVKLLSAQLNGSI